MSDNIITKIEAAIDRRLASNKGVCFNEWGIEYNIKEAQWEALGDKVCPLSCVVLQNQPFPYMTDEKYGTPCASVVDTVADLLNVNSSWVLGFIDAYDGKQILEINSSSYGIGYATGLKIRNKVLGKNDNLA